ncbi:MAG: UDP-glucose/GDP-mannose dehydrogenase family protein [Buchananella hordeovulneris]|nr:UDP-glucose/GDP-mannose dehydrogenase family protein [Buchananella hordeovulneris]
MRISVIGCGYLGAVHAASMAHLGHDVVGIDVDADKVALLNEGVAPFYEPGFEEVLRPALASGRLRFTSDAATAGLADVDVHFIAVGTPQSPTGNAANLSYLWAAVDCVLDNVPAHAAHQPIVVGKSTVPVGTAQAVAERLERAGITLVWNPEFLREGFAVQDTLHPDRIVYGLPKDAAGHDFTPAGKLAAAKLDDVYADLLAEGIERLLADYPTSELVKVAANSFLATKISFINAMAELCEATGGDVTVLADAIGRDERIGRRFLGAGIGFGGGCLPKDIRAFMARAEELGVEDAVSFLRDVDAINGRRRQRVVDLATSLLGGQLAGKRVTILGAAFKPNSDDLRDSPALDVARRLEALGASVLVTDPKALERVRATAPTLAVEEDVERALAGADLVVLATEWQEFVTLDPVRCASLVNSPVMVDARNALAPKEWRAAGWNYHGLGR